MHVFGAPDSSVKSPAGARRCAEVPDGTRVMRCHFGYLHPSPSQNQVKNTRKNGTRRYASRRLHDFAVHNAVARTPSRLSVSSTFEYSTSTSTRVVDSFVYIAWILTTLYLAEGGTCERLSSNASLITLEAEVVPRCWIHHHLITSRRFRPRLAAYSQPWVKM